MSDTSNSTLTHLTYTVRSGANIISQVNHIILVVLPRGILIAGYNTPGDLLTTQFVAYKKSMPQWVFDFYEHLFLEEEILASTEKIKAVFVAAEKYLIVPDALYEADEARTWLEKLFFIESNDTVDKYSLTDDQAQYLYAYPVGIKNIVNRYFPQAKLLPLSGYQFLKPFKSDVFIQCCITSETVCATMYNNKSLQWHQVFAYENAEDIAYQLNLMMQQYRVVAEQEVELLVAVVNKDLNPILLDLSQYFPNLKYRNGSNNYNDAHEWTPTIALLQHLFSCVS